MDYSPHQKQAIQKIVEWYEHSSKPYFHLAGYAGTGKTVITKGVIQALDCDTTTALCAYTAKAAKNLSKKSGCPATTIHRTIYDYRPHKELDEAKGELKSLRSGEQTGKVLQKIDELIERIHKLTEQADRSGSSYQRKETLGETSLIVADECSMISEAILSDLLSFGVKVLFVGDHGQLPPIQKGGKSMYDLIPMDYELTEIIRHDNDIVEFAEMARQRRFIPFRESKNGFGKISKTQAMDGGYLSQFDQIICHTNRTRRMLNQALRKLHGYKGVYPERSERVICRFNNNKMGISRGTIFTVLQQAEKRKRHLNMELRGEEDQTYILQTDPRMFEAYHNPLLADDIDKQRAVLKPFPPPFDFGYAVTVHAAQGSEWERVLVWDDYCAKPEEYPKWLYTAITRAEKEVVIAA